MNKFKNIGLFLSAILLFVSFWGSSQVVPTTQDSIKILFRREKSYSINIHTQGFGIGYRQGKHLTGYKKLMYEGEFLMMKHPKEFQSINQFYSNSKGFIYGKLNNFFILRGGVGIQKVINSKPYWGGVEVRYFYYGGMSMGLTKPVYLYIFHQIAGTNEGDVTLERYDPNNINHSIDNIYGRAPFVNGLNQIKVHPGLYGKFGFNFEFGQEDTKIRSLEAGINLDAYPKAIPLMAFNKSNNFFLTVYLSYSFGKRYN